MVDKIVELSKYICKYTVGTEGNVSGKIGDKFLIKASGKSLSNLTEFDLVLCDMNCNKIDNRDLNPSMEAFFHSWIYQTFGVNYISHTHPTSTLKILCSDQVKFFAKKRLFPDQVVFNGIESCVVEYSHPGENLLKEIKKSVKKFKKKKNCLPKLILLKNHGIITFGKTIQECIVSSEMCEKSAEIFLENKKNSVFLKKNEISRIISDDKEKYRQNLISK